MKRKYLLIVPGFLLMLLMTLSLQACSDAGDRPVAQSPVASTQARTITLKSVDVATHYVTSGTVTSDHRVSISSRVSGYIRKLSVREGDRVKKGQVLVRVDPVNARQALVQAEADLANAKVDLKRYESLYRDHAASQQQLDRVRLRYKLTRSQAAQARNQLGFSEVVSPVNGVVVEKRLSKGDLAQPGAAILTLEDPSSLLVKTYVSEQYVSAIHAGDKVAVDIPSMQRRLVGIVRQVVEAADAVSHQFLIKITLQNGGSQYNSAVHPGMYAQVGFSTGMRKALMIPAAAVVERAGLHGVYIVDGKSIAHYRQIRVGETRTDEKRGTEVELLAGLHDGDVVAWAGKPALQTGMKVQ
ncbi:efflux RND transporter periplasmic adaptor subunit [Mariprofundus ferrooxydans]|nr:efflux RND transporter periplasmic adaptor subunit [Mariprofundus ferrooxydans]